MRGTGRACERGGGVGSRSIFLRHRRLRGMLADVLLGVYEGRELPMTAMKTWRGGDMLGGFSVDCSGWRGGEELNINLSKQVERTDESIR